MTHKEFEQVFERAVERSKGVLFSKLKEYTSDDDQLESFKTQAGMSLAATPMGIAYELMVKHIYSVRKMVQEFEECGKRPSIRLMNEKFGDSINYLILIEALFLESIYLTQQEDNFYPDSNEHSVHRWAFKRHA